MVKGWIKLEKQLLNVAKVRNVMNGAEVDWSHSHTILLLYMKDRAEHFKRQGAEYFDNQETLAREVGMSVASVKRRLKEFYDLGAVLVTKKKLKGFLSSNSYYVLDVFNAPMFEITLLSGEVIRAEAPRKFVLDRVALGIGVSDPGAPF